MVSMFSGAKKHCDDECYSISFDTCISEDDFTFFKKTLDNVIFEKWNLIEIESIVKSQKIVHKLVENLTDDIDVVHELKGYPSLHKECNMH